jgi:hypothetical protein
MTANEFFEEMKTAHDDAAWIASEWGKLAVAVAEKSLSAADEEEVSVELQRRTEVVDRQKKRLEAILVGARIAYRRRTGSDPDPNDKPSDEDIEQGGQIAAAMLATPEGAPN